jgi:hypothetical protein
VTETPLRAITALVLTMLMTVDAGVAQEAPTAPRIPMRPGSSFPLDTQMMQAHDRERALSDILGAQPAQPAIAPPALPNTLGPETLDTAAMKLAAEGSADIVVSSHAQTDLVLQLYRPEQNQWQLLRLPPMANTPISCEACKGTLHFSFNDSVEDSQIALEAPAVLRIYADPRKARWRWESFKLQAVSVRD